MQEMRKVKRRRQVETTQRDFYDTEAASVYLRGRGVKLSPRTMMKWRTQSHNLGPRYEKIGRKVYYRKSELEAFLHRNTMSTVTMDT